MSEQNYRVLARKYRPASFADLIGQEPMVKTLSNAFKTNRIAQAWILTGVRGVGKTTTARILARGLNYQTKTHDAPTVDMPVLGVHCQAIMESRHVDVIEMDAASNTGINDIREVIESARYRPASARYKVFIIDEVHMLSTAAFNGLLKTLEEPPPHVKFIFATTEIRKVPITVLSRCQRFDLRRIERPMLVAHLRSILAQEQITAEDEALALIAQASEGSVRDSLSLTDQAIATGAGHVGLESVQMMLGLADRAQIVALFSAALVGDFKTALAILRAQYDLGADLAAIFGELADLTHVVTRMKLVPNAGEEQLLHDVDSLKNHAESLSLRVLSRLFSVLMKGFEEVKGSTKPLQSAEMVLIRLCHLADLPSPEEAVQAFHTQRASLAMPEPSLKTVSQQKTTSQIQQKILEEPRFSPAPRAALSLASHALVQPLVSQSPQTVVQEAQYQLNSLEDIAALARAKREMSLTIAIENNVHFVSITQGHLSVALTPTAPPTLVNDLARKLKEWTGRPWLVTLSEDRETPPLALQRAQEKERLLAEGKNNPLVQTALGLFTGATLVGVYMQDEENHAPFEDEILGEESLPSFEEFQDEREEDDF